MKAFSILLLLGLSMAYCHVIDRCKVVRAAREVGFGKNTANIVCVAAHASNYDTSLHRSSTEYGLLQINSYWWCDDGKTPGRKNGCKVSCKALLNNDIIDDLKCALRIISDPNGFGAWDPWTKYCKGKDLSSYIKDC